MTIFSLAVLAMTNAGWADSPKPVARATNAGWAADPFEKQVLPVSLRDEPPAKTPTPKPSGPTPKGSADEWRPFAANPSYEVYGHIENGVFRYTQYRAKATTFRAAPRYYAPVLQYGSPCANGSCPR